MSRFNIYRDKIRIAYGYDHMSFVPGYFFQVFDMNAITESNDEGLIVNEGFFKGIGKVKMLELMESYKIKNDEHFKLVSLDLPL